MKGLERAKSVFLKQTIEWVEMMAGYETPNRYQVYYKNPEDEKYTMLFACKEMSSYWVRNCCSGEYRSYILNMKHIQTFRRNDDFTKDIYAVLNRDYALPLCCLCRNDLSGSFGNSEGQKFGKVTSPYSLCDPVFKVVNSSGKVAFSLTSDCCKCGFLCRGCCGLFEPVTFLIFAGDTFDSKQVNMAVGRIIKNAMGIQSLSDEDNFELFFPLEATPEEKLLLISAALLIDYVYFEENPNTV